MNSQQTLSRTCMYAVDFFFVMDCVNFSSSSLILLASISGVVIRERSSEACDHRWEINESNRTHMIAYVCSRIDAGERGRERERYRQQQWIRLFPSSPSSSSSLSSSFNLSLSLTLSFFVCAANYRSLFTSLPLLPLLLLSEWKKSETKRNEKRASG